MIDTYPPCPYDPTPVPAPERVRRPVPVGGYPVEGTHLRARWVRSATARMGLLVEVTNVHTGVTAVESLEDLNRAADREPGGIAHRVLRAVEGVGR